LGSSFSEQEAKIGIAIAVLAVAKIHFGNQRVRLDCFAITNPL
jgi:hypothetical protein